MKNRQRCFGIEAKTKHLIIHVTETQHAEIARRAMAQGMTRTSLLIRYINAGEKALHEGEKVADMPKRAPTAAERRHMQHVSEMPCLVCGSPSTIHHVTSDGHQRIARSNWLVTPLCPRHHQIQHGPRESVEALGHAGFTATYDIDLLHRARMLRDASPYWTGHE